MAPHYVARELLALGHDVRGTAGLCQAVPPSSQSQSPRFDHSNAALKSRCTSNNGHDFKGGGTLFSLCVGQHYQPNSIWIKPIAVPLAALDDGID